MAEVAITITLDEKAFEKAEAVAAKHGTTATEAIKKFIDDLADTGQSKSSIGRMYAKEWANFTFPVAEKE